MIREERRNEVRLGRKDWEILMERLVTGLGLFSIVVMLVRFRLLWVMLLAVISGAAYDFGSLKTESSALDILLRISCLYLVTSSSFVGYWYFSPRVVLAVVVAQLGDACQYFVGQRWPHHKIGWISPNKTYEGYGGGFLLMLCILPVFFPLLLSILDMPANMKFSDVLVFYILSCTSSMYFSLIKRIIKIKDWSDLLGKHGGLLDRLDSICLPLLYIYYY